jgi:hypothetical protein
VLLGDAPGHRQAQTGAAALGRIIRLEDFVQYVGRNARAGVDDVDDGLPSVRCGGKDQFAAASRGIACTALIMRFRMACLTASASTQRSGRGDGCWPQAKLHALKLGLRGEEIDQFLQQSIEIGGPAIEFQFAGVAKEIVENLAQAGGFALHRGQAIAQALVIAIENRGLP